MKNSHIKNILLLLLLPLCSVGCPITRSSVAYWNRGPYISKEERQMGSECLDEARYIFHGGEYINEIQSNAETNWQIDCVRQKQGEKPQYEDSYRDQVNKYKMESGSLKHTQ